MKYLFTLLLLSSCIALSAQSLPIHFEGDVGVSDFEDFDGGTFDLVANPSADATNASENVGQIVRNGGLIWSGSKIVLDDYLDFTENNSLSLKIYTTAPVGTVVKFKLEGEAYTERDVLTTVTGEWEELNFDFTGEILGAYNTLVFMFDYGNVGNGSENSTFYFDDINQGTNGEQLDYPVTFEDPEINYSVIDFGGNFSVVTEDPTEPSNTVVKSIKSATAETWAGTTIGTAAGFISFLPLTMEDSKMSVRVWSASAGTPVRLKVEAWYDATQTCETQVNTTLDGEWETLIFDFANEAPGTATLSDGLNMGWAYNKASIFFNYGISGAQAGEQTYYFDDVYFGEMPIIDNVEDLDNLEVQVYPNPSNRVWNFSSSEIIESIILVNAQGQLFTKVDPQDFLYTLASDQLAEGIYFAQVVSAGKVQTFQLLRQ